VRGLSSLHNCGECSNLVFQGSTGSPGHSTPSLNICHISDTLLSVIRKNEG